MPADLAALLQGEPGGFGILLAQQLLRARLLGSRAALAPALLTLHACSIRVPCLSIQCHKLQASMPGE